MNMEIHVPSEHTEQLTISVDTDYGDGVSLGWKKFQAIGEFKYSWVIQHLNRDEVVALRDCLNYAISLTGDGPE